MKRRSFIAALAGLPLVGRLFGKRPIEQPIAFPAPEPVECTITDATLFSEAGEVAFTLSSPLYVSVGVKPSFALDTPRSPDTA